MTSTRRRYMTAKPAKALGRSARARSAGSAMTLTGIARIRSVTPLAVSAVTGHDHGFQTEDHGHGEHVGMK